MESQRVPGSGAADGASEPAVLAINLGLDIGQKHDPSAVVIVEVGERVRTPTGRRLDLDMERFALQVPGARKETTYRVQHMGRLDLGTDYLDVARHVARLVVGLWEWERAERFRGRVVDPTGVDASGRRPLPVHLYADATGVGAPVMDMLRQALRDDPRSQRCWLHELTFTHGDQYDRSEGRLGKAYLVSRLMVLFQEHLLAIPRDDPEADAMLRELKDYEIRIDENANDKYGAFKVGTHDDLVTALGLATVDDPARYRMQVGPRLF
jgi:hypothetical protein